MSRTSVSDLPRALQEFRASCPLVEQIIYLANCSQAPQSKPVQAGIGRFLESWATLGMHWGGWIEEVEEARAGFAALIGASKEDIAIGASVSQLVSSLASALVQPQATRKRILSSVVEFPGVGQAWHAAVRAVPGWKLDLLTGTEAEALEADTLAAQRAGLLLRHTHPSVVVSTAQFAAAIDETTALVSAPLVSYTNGALLDAQALCAAAHQQGTLVLLDAYQASGSVPIDVQASQVDFVTAGALKYMMGTAGIAFLYVSPRVRERFEPSMTGWFGRVNPFDFNSAGLDYPPEASRFDLGTPPLINAFAARAGIELVRQTGVDAIQAQIDRLSALAYRAAPERGLKILGPQSGTPKGAITAIDAGSPERAHWLEDTLRQHGVIASARGEAVRLAPHGFTLESELEQALDHVAALLKSAPAQAAV
ncbi:MAG TPA: aminotransferase class V-fold PLP-dependent enzyme [Ktedonobacterales bacterium]|nr:aminotransferase class V-fold PLP-dependent enzyme [Ktedonobacterales bacterium]